MERVRTGDDRQVGRNFEQLGEVGEGRAAELLGHALGALEVDVLDADDPGADGLEAGAMRGEDVRAGADDEDSWAIHRSAIPSTRSAKRRVGATHASPAYLPGSLRETHQG